MIIVRGLVLFSGKLERVTSSKVDENGVVFLKTETHTRYEQKTNFGAQPPPPQKKWEFDTFYLMSSAINGKSREPPTIIPSDYPWS